MLSNSHRTMIQTKGVVIGRVLMGLLFFGSGLGMLFVQGPAGVAGFFGSLGMPLPLLMAWIAIIIKIGAGGALMLGKCPGKAAALLIAFTLIATAIAHADINDTGLFKNLAIIGGLLYVMAFGPGSWSGKQHAKAGANVCTMCGKEKSACTCNSQTK